MNRQLSFAVVVSVMSALPACVPPDQRFIQHMEAHPEDRPPNWEQVKALMDRPAPAVGDPAPDFELADSAGSQSIRRSEHQTNRPQVLIFGSFT